MSKIYSLLILLLIPFLAEAQDLPDSVVIVRNTFVNTWNYGGNEDSLYRSNRYVFVKGFSSYNSPSNSIDTEVISDLVYEINYSDNLSNSLSRYGIDTNWIKNNPAKLIKMSPNQKKFVWNKQQTEFIENQITNLKNYENVLSDYLNMGCCYTMHSSYRYEILLTFYSKGGVVEQIKSKKFNWGYMFPWTDLKGRKLHSYKIEELLDVMLNSNRKIKAPIKGRKLLKQLANEVLQRNAANLYKLSPYTYQKQIDELKQTFDIISFKEMTGHGGYHGAGPLIQVILKNDIMLPNVSVEFLASKTGITIYSRDSVKNDHKDIVNRIQSIKFIKNYLKEHPKSNLKILYFNNKPINQYNTDQIKSSKFSEDFLHKAIMFIIEDDNGSHSRWVLLPDNTALLFLTQGLNFKFLRYTAPSGFEYPNLRFDTDGNVME